MARYKKWFALAAVALTASMLAAGCGSAGNGPAAAPENNGEVTLRIGSAPVPHAEILNFIKPALKEQGVNLEITVFDEETRMNPALKEGEIDANYFQHEPYLDSIKEEQGFDFAVVAKVHVEPIGFYSDRIKSIDELQDGSEIGIPNNAANEYRSLILLEQQGLIKLRDDLVNNEATPKDIVDNPKNLKFREVDSATLPRVLPDLDGAIINTNLILEAKLDPNSALFRENAESPYGNIVVVRKGEENGEAVKKLVAALTTPEVRKFIEDRYGVAVVPVF